MKYTCDNCGYRANREKFKDAEDLSMRLSPGCIYTDVECPKEDCGALAYPDGPDHD